MTEPSTEELLETVRDALGEERPARARGLALYALNLLETRIEEMEKRLAFYRAELEETRRHRDRSLACLAQRTREFSYKRKP